MLFRKRHEIAISVLIKGTVSRNNKRFQVKKTKFTLV